MIAKLIFFVVTMVNLAGQYAPPEFPHIEFDMSPPLGEGPREYCYGLTMDVHGTGRDAVIFVQGGRWSGGNRNVGLAYSGLVDMGYVLVLIDLEPGAPAQFRDLTCAIDYLLDHGIQRIGVVGKSSGGHVAALAGLLYKVDFAVVISAPLDLTVGCKDDVAGAYFGASCGSDALLQYSPAHWISSKWHPVFLVIQGLNDGVVSPKHARIFSRKMEEVGARAILRLYSGGHEGLYIEDVLDFVGRVFG